MYVLEEYLAAIVLAIVLGVAGMALLVLVLPLKENEDGFFDHALRTGTFALPPQWPRLWLLMTIAETRRALSTSFAQRAKLYWRRVYPRPWRHTLGKSCAAASQNTNRKGDGRG